MFKITIFAFSLFLFTLASFSNDLSTFQEFGEKEGLTRVVNDMMINLLANEKTRPFFEKADQVHIKEKLVEQFCMLLDGPCTYSGQNMKRAHKGHEINTSQFYALVESLQAAMVKNRIDQRAQNKLLSKLAPMHKDIINK